MRTTRDGELPLSPLVSIGFDWITGTAAEGFTETEWDALCGLLLTGPHQQDNFARSCVLQGYEGIKCGQAFCGLRHDGAMVQVTGELADKFWRPVVQFCSNVPRIDLQATVRYTIDPFRVVLRADKDMRAAKKRRGRGPKIHLDRGEDGGVTAYVGRKSSRRYGRIYNKWAESGLEEFRDCVRFEAIFREDLGRRVTRFIERYPDPYAGIHAVLWSYFDEVGARPPALRDAASLLRAPEGFFRSRKLSDAARKVLWLREQVRPTVQLLCESGYADLVEDALGVSVAPRLGPTKEDGPWDSTKPC